MAKKYTDAELLKKEIEKYFQGLWPGMETAEQCNTDMHFTPPAIMRLANHFYKLGKQCKEPVNEDLEKEIENTIDNTFCDMNGIAYLGITAYATVEDMKYIARHFANWQKKQMLKYSVMAKDVDTIVDDIMKEE